MFPCPRLARLSLSFTPSKQQFPDRGCVVGGSSAVNFATYNKPSKEDIDGLLNTNCFPTGRTDKYSLGDTGKWGMELGQI